jgi:hypothetical protein
MKVTIAKYAKAFKIKGQEKVKKYSYKNAI